MVFGGKVITSEILAFYLSITFLFYPLRMPTRL